MKLNGQRWRYQLENSEVIVDNAFSRVGWVQERLVINGESIQSVSGWFNFRRAFREPWLTPTGDGELSIKMWSALNRVEVEVRLKDELIEPTGLSEANWLGRGAWPKEADWITVTGFSIFKNKK